MLINAKLDTTPIQRLCHEVEAALRRTANVEVIKLEEGQQVVPANPPSHDPFGLKIRVPMVLPDGTYENRDYGLNAPALAVPPVTVHSPHPGQTPLEPAINKLLLQMFQELTRKKIEPRYCRPWHCDNPDALAGLYAFNYGPDFLFVLTVEADTSSEATAILGCMLNVDANHLPNS